MHLYEPALSHVLEVSFSGPGERVLPEYAVRGLAVRISPRWWEQAACRGIDTEAWFPDERAHPEPLLTRVCAGCPVRKSCLASAVLHDEEGIWGGTRRGQRLHARARLLAGDSPGDVLGDLLHSPLPATDYTIPDPILDPVATPTDADQVAWREAS